VSDDNGIRAYRRIGEILVAKHLIAPGQLERALAVQQRTGRLLGEICVATFGLERMSLADVLAEQWDEMRHADEMSCAGGRVCRSTGGLSTESALQVLLEEAHAARLDLTSRTDELGKRLATLEALVVGVGEALAGLATAGTGAPAPKRRGATKTASATPTPKTRRVTKGAIATPTPKKPRASTQPSNSRAKSA
jgi:hypothetical protein